MLEEFAKEIAATIKKSVAESITAMMQKYESRFADLENNKMPREEIEKFALDAIMSAFAQLPKAENGKPGEKGDTGPQGIPGEKGEAGESVNIEEVKAILKELVAELPAPENGKDGRDALSLEILPNIDEKNVYSRGHFALHNGGLWRSYEKTKGMHGWECIVEGINAITVSAITERDFNFIIQKSSGVISKLEFTVPVMIYRGYYNEQAKYTEGDMVTFGGSMWYCKSETQEKPSDNAAEWIKSVRRGRDSAVKL